MSRSGYSEDNDQWALIRWRGAVVSAIRGRRGQAFLREMISALDELPEKKLIAHDLIIEDSALADAGVCALGAVGVRRGNNMRGIDPEDHYEVAAFFDISHALACEIMYMNDEAAGHNETPHERYARIRRWVMFLIQ